MVDPPPRGPPAKAHCASRPSPSCSGALRWEHLQRDPSVGRVTLGTTPMPPVPGLSRTTKRPSRTGSGAPQKFHLDGLLNEIAIDALERGRGTISVYITHSFERVVVAIGSPRRSVDRGLEPDGPRGRHQRCLDARGPLPRPARVRAGSSVSRGRRAARPLADGPQRMNRPYGASISGSGPGSVSPSTPAKGVEVGAAGHCLARHSRYSSERKRSSAPGPREYPSR